jgi:hypothetical protein
MITLPWHELASHYAMMDQMKIRQLEQTIEAKNQYIKRLENALLAPPAQTTQRKDQANVSH